MSQEELAAMGLLPPQKPKPPPQHSHGLPHENKLAKATGRRYNRPVDSLACQLKEATVDMASPKTVKGGIRNNWLKIAKKSEYFSVISG